MTIDVELLLKIAQQAAVEAGDLLRENRHVWNSVQSETERDVKNRADQQSEKIILSYLQSKTDIPILSEEAGWLDTYNDGLCWIVDPLDGTVNYTQGIPICCVSIALVKDKEPVLGVVYDFNRKEVFSGIVGQGATLNGQRIKVSETDRRERAVLNTGLPSKGDFSDEGLSAFAKQVKPWRKVRMLGSAALSLAYVASGRSDAYQEKNIMYWDIAAGSALVMSAGGAVNLKATEDYIQPVSVHAANKTLLNYMQ